MVRNAMILGMVVLGGVALVGWGLRTEEAAPTEVVAEDPPAEAAAASPEGRHPEPSVVEPSDNPDYIARYDHANNYAQPKVEGPDRPSVDVDDWARTRAEADEAWRVRTVAAVRKAAADLEPDAQARVVEVVENLADGLAEARKRLGEGQLEPQTFRNVTREARNEAQAELVEAAGAERGEVLWAIVESGANPL